MRWDHCQLVTITKGLLVEQIVVIVESIEVVTVVLVKLGNL